jgi:hypothetical protein
MVHARFCLLLRLLFLAVVPTVTISTTSTTPSCAVLDWSSSSAGGLEEALTQARARKAASLAGCVDVKLGRRSFYQPQTLVLTAADSGTNLIGGEITAGVDVPPSAWKQKVSSSSSSSSNSSGPAALPGTKVLELDTISLLALNGSSAQHAAFGSPLGTTHLQLLVEVQGVWRPMTLARWPNIPFEFDEVPPVAWTTVGALPDPKCGVLCKSFEWANDTERPSRWAKAATEGRLFIHGFFKYRISGT